LDIDRKQLHRWKKIALNYPVGHNMIYGNCGRRKDDENGNDM
jgi:hypothetical protein